MLGSGVPAHVSMAGVHRVASLVQRWVLGTHHGSVQPDHLDAYLDEFVFRFNRRTSSSRGMLFYRCCSKRWITAASDVWGCREQEHRESNRIPLLDEITVSMGLLELNRYPCICTVIHASHLPKPKLYNPRHPRTHAALPNGSRALRDLARVGQRGSVRRPGRPPHPKPFVRKAFAKYLSAASLPMALPALAALATVGTTTL